MKKISNKIKHQTKACICLILIISLLITPLKVLAVDLNFYSSNDILYFNPDCASTGSGGSSTLIGSDNAEKILRFLVDKGLTLIQAAGVIGNFYEESGLDPSNVQKTADTTDPDYKPIPNDGFGIAQWTDPDRQEKMYAYHQKTGGSMVDLAFQLDWFWEEFSGQYVGALVTLKEMTTIEDAALDFHSKYEGSNDTAEMIQERVTSGTDLYNQYKSIIKDGTSSGTASSGGSCNSGTKKTNGEFIFYNQYDPQWKDIALGSSGLTIGSGGCGPTAMAMIITALTGTKVTPVEVSQKAVELGIIDSAGTKLHQSPALAEAFGLKGKQVAKDAVAISDALKRGSMIHISGDGGINPWTDAGHYIAIRGITAEGKWLIADSYNLANNDLEWDPNSILTDGVNANIYEIYK